MCLCVLCLSFGNETVVDVSVCTLSFVNETMVDVSVCALSFGNKTAPVCTMSMTFLWIYEAPYV